PHRFWLVDGASANRVSIEDDDTVHLMVSAWDAATGVAVPAASPSVTVTSGGSPVAARTLWRMLSQNMGFHYGDNVTLDGAGDYEVTVEFGPVGARRTGAFRDAFGDVATATVPLSFSESTLQEVPYRELGRAGLEGAVDPMESMTVPQVPAADALPGAALGSGSVGDASLVGRRLAESPAGVGGSDPYLAVSARTPYNRYPLPFAALSATVDGAAVSLTPTLDPELHYHYGATVPGLTADASVSVRVDTPPQVSRHEGYETA
ncbi:MAG: iron transporter, partial [Haloglomus sp.]